MGTSRHTGQHPLSCPQSYWPWTWPQFRYTYGCCFSFTVSSLILEVNLRGITSVFSSTGHCGWPAFNSSTSVSKWRLVWKTGIVSFTYNFFTLFNAIPMKIWYTRVKRASLALVNTVPVANVWALYKMWSIPDSLNNYELGSDKWSVQFWSMFMRVVSIRSPDPAAW